MPRYDVRQVRRLFGLALLTALASAADAQENVAAPPSVFASDSILSLTIRADLRTLLRDRGEDRKEHKGVMRYPRADGTVDSLPVELRTRGIFRRRPSVCSFPPLRLSIRRRDARNTPFDGERRIKLVTHCRPTDQYEQYTLQEYLLYRVYGVLSDLSLRTRLARITYEDASGREKPETRYAILIEDEERLADRHRMKVVEDTGVSPARLDPSRTVFMAVFQYFIGNTDWSVRVLHNIILLSDSLGQIAPVPYDFDWSGVISTRYAQPDTSLPIRNVRERLYSGYCGEASDFNAIFAQYRQHRAAIEALYNLEPLDQRNRERSLAYYAEFYRMIDDPARVTREMLRLCR